MFFDLIKSNLGSTLFPTLNRSKLVVRGLILSLGDVKFTTNMLNYWTLSLFLYCPQKLSTLPPTVYINSTVVS